MPARKAFPFNQSLADEICERLVEGESLRAICREKHMPSAGHVHRWLREREEFLNQYVRAKDDQADTLADEMLDIADNSALASDDRRVRLDTRKWLAGKMKPKKWGDKLEVGGSFTVNLESDTSKL